MSRRIFVTGGTGFIGRSLVAALHKRGDRAVVVSRDRSRAQARLGDGVDVVEGDPNYAGDWQEAVRGCDAVVNLAGASVGGKRWTAQYKQILRDSRVETTRHVIEAIARLAADERPAVLVSASGIDYYPFSEDLAAALPVDENDAVTERSPVGSTFLARLCRHWEREALEAEKLDLRVVLMRTAVVLGPDDDGPLARMTTPFRLFVGGRIGNGRQWFTWIHIDDAVGGYLFALDQAPIHGPVNLTSPGPVRNREFAATLGQVLGRPAWLPVPRFALEAAIGEFAEHLLHGRRALPAVLSERGYPFAFPELRPALQDILD